MAAEINIDLNLGKQEKYDLLIPQIKALIDGENDITANLGNIAAALKYGMEWLWVGFYFVKKRVAVVTSGANDADELVLGPFQGPVACTRIQYGRGVCGAAWKSKTVIIVDDVDQFPGHIACNSLSKSEIVLPAFKNDKVILVLDIDSERLASFDETDQKNLQKVINLVETFF